jgi:hypothetical protein
VNENSTGALDTCWNRPLPARVAVTWQVVGATVVDRVEPATAQPAPVAVKDTGPWPDPPDVTRPKAPIAGVDRVALVMNKGACDRPVKVKSTGALVAAAWIPLAALLALTVHVVGAVVVDREAPYPGPGSEPALRKRPSMYTPPFVGLLTRM